MKERAAEYRRQKMLNGKIAKYIALSREPAVLSLLFLDREVLTITRSLASFFQDDNIATQKTRNSNKKNYLPRRRAEIWYYIEAELINYNQFFWMLSMELYMGIFERPLQSFQHGQ